MKHVIYYLSVILFMVSAVAYAQAPRLYGTKQGLPDTKIDHIFFDKDNFLWIASSNGLTRFDGQSFSSYFGEKGNPYALNDSRVTTMYESTDGKHWIGAGDGLYFLCRTENKFSHFVIDPNRPNISVTKIIQHPAEENTLILATAGFGLFFFDKESQTFDLGRSDRLSVCLKRWNCTSMLTDRYNRLWVTHPNGLICIDLEKYERIEFPDAAMNTDQFAVQDIVEDRRRGLLYMATLHHGLVRCNLMTLQIERTDIPELNDKNLTALCVDSSGDLIIGTENQGLYRMNNNKVSAIVADECPVDLNHIKIHSIALDGQDNLWLGIYQKGVLVLPRQETIFKSTLIKQYGSSHNLDNVSSFAQLNDGSRLYGLDGGGLAHHTADGTIRTYNTDNSIFGSDAVLALATAPDGTAYVGTYNYGIYVFDGKKIVRNRNLEALDNQSIMQIVCDKNHNTLYIGTNGNGVYRYDMNSQGLERISDEPHMLWTTGLFIDSRNTLWLCMSGGLYNIDIYTGRQRTVYDNNPVRATSFDEDENGTIWMATDNGLAFVEAGSDSIRYATDTHGRTLDERYMALVRNTDGFIWITSNTGIISYNPADKTVMKYFDPVIDDIASYSPHAAIQWTDGEISFGGDNGILSFSPEKVNSYHRPLQPIFLTRLWVNNEPIDYDPALSDDENMLDESLWKATTLHLPSTENSFSVSFAVQEYCNPVGIRYRYMLEGHDKDWHLIFDNRQTATYSSLRSGHYSFMVQAFITDSNGNIQTTERTLSVIIDAPWWNTWWAYILYLAFIATLSFLTFRYFRQRAHQHRVLLRTQHNRQIKEAKLRMFASVSHEIRTPIALIISPLRKLMQRNNDNSTQSVYEMMYRNSLRILMLVNQQIDIRKLDSGQLKLHIQEIDIQNFIGDLMQYFSNAALNRQIDFRFFMDTKDQGLRIWADPQQIDKVFFNLISNAFKYVNDNGLIHIKVSSDTLLQTCLIELHNTGGQLPDSNINNSIAKYSGSDGATEIGINLAKELAELHHGSLSARNDEDGVTFFLTLRLGNKHFTAEELKPVDKAVQLEMEENIEKEAQAGITQPQPVVNESKEQGSDKDLINMLNDELQEKKRMRERRSNLGFDYTQTQMSSADEKLLQRVVDCIHKNLGDSEFNVDAMAQQVGLSRVHLNRKLKELLDTSPSSLIKTTRLKQAAFLLAQSNVTVAEVAYSVGFSSPAYFTSNFSQYFGMTPKEFISTYNENPDSDNLKRLLE